MSDTLTAPWPLVHECYGHPDGGHCAQCDGGHRHNWRAWHDAPETRPGSGVTVVDGHSGPGLPVRCTVCGARKCDDGDCSLRRHHREGHDPF